MKVRVIKANDENWYKVGEEYDVEVFAKTSEHGLYHPLFGGKNYGISPDDFEVVLREEAPQQGGWSDAHYSSFVYTLTEEDKKAGSLKVDPYFVAMQWQLGKKDDTGVLFHNLKNIARFGEKNSKEREIVALYKQIKRLAQLEGVTLGD